MPIQNIIKEKRKELGLTQEQIAEYLGVSTPAVNKWENGITYPDITLIASIGSQFANLMQLTDYYQLTPTLEVAAHNKDENTCLTILERLFASMQKPWNFNESFLFRHIYTNMKEPAPATSAFAQIIPAVINQLETDPEFEFLRNNKRFEELIKPFK